MNKQFQRNRIEAGLRKAGFDSDLIDLDANIDSTLRLDENYNKIFSDMRGIGIQKQEPGSKAINKINNYQKAEEIFQRRPIKSQMMDVRFKAKEKIHMDELTNKKFNRGKKNPNRMDIIGVDLI